MWNVENIPDESSVYIRIHKDFISSKDDLPKSAAFSNTPKDGDNLSCDWDKHCTANSARSLIGKQTKKDGSYKNHTLFFMWEMNVGEIRTKLSPTQLVNHEPIQNEPEIVGLPNNRAHSIIIGDKQINSAEFRVSILKLGKWAISPKI